MKIIHDIKALIINDELFILEALHEIIQEAGIENIDRA